MRKERSIFPKMLNWSIKKTRHTRFTFTFTHNEPLHRVQCQTVLVSNRWCVWWTLTLWLYVAHLFLLLQTVLLFITRCCIWDYLAAEMPTGHFYFLFYMISLFGCGFFSIYCSQKVKFTSECSDNAPIMTFILICVGFTNNSFYLS